MRLGFDEVDIWARNWAHERRIMLGIVKGDKIEPKERIGKLKCTLARVREEGDGAAQSGPARQSWPEVYTGFAMLVHRVYLTMPLTLKNVMHLHYVWWEIPSRLKAERAEMSVAKYWYVVAHVKSYVYGAVTVNYPDSKSMTSAESR